MSTTHVFARGRFGARVASLTIIGMLSPSVAPLVAAQAPATKAPAVKAPAATTPAAKTPAASATTPAAPDGGWPRTYTTSSGAALLIYQPQVASWTDQKHATLYAAVSYTSKGAKQAALGTISVESETKVAVDERLVSFSDFKIGQSNFPTLQRDAVKTVVSEISTSVPLDERVIALDRVLANIDTSLIIPKNVEGVKADPPTIFFSETPAVLVNIDGEPIWSPIPQNDLRSAVNTNWDLFEHGPSKTYYLRNDRMWMKASDVKGPWTPAGKLPLSFDKLPADENWKDVKATLPGQQVSASKMPKVFVSFEPAELILLRGKPSYLKVEGAKQLLWVNNTDSDIFRMSSAGSVYFLVAGRWFSAPDFTGPWTFATPKLPDDFKQIPLEHERSRVLASVPGTTQAMEAVVLAGIPQTARVSRTVMAPEVAYQGDPQFEPIEKTSVQRAVNTDKDILKVGDLYYMCFQGVWFMSKAPTGPWQVTSDVPKTIYEIPVSSPSHAVTYVTVEESSSDAVVYATAAAYTGVMVAWGCAVWGTGYYYPPYIGYGGMYPYYRPYYPTYGFGASYNPWTGAYSRGAVAYGPYGGAGVGQRYNPRTGTYSRGAVAYGPYGARGAASAYNPRTGAYGTTRQGSNVYGSWGQTGVARGDQWATSSRYTSNVTGNTTRVTQGSEGGGAITRNAAGAGGRSGVARTEGGDVYAGRDGNVYKKDGDSWQKYDNGGWTGADGPTQQQRQQAQDRAQQSGTQRDGASASGWDSSTSGQVQRDSAARAEGAQRTRDAGSVNSGASSRSGSYRPSGGASRGGGGRRR
jgi:hypothetical protein